MNLIALVASVVTIITLAGVEAQTGGSCYVQGQVGREGPWPGDAGKTQGVCSYTSTCSSMGGRSYAGYCPGAANIQCCISPQCGPVGPYNIKGFCAGTNACANMSGYDGDSYTGACPGPSNYQV